VPETTTPYRLPVRPADRLYIRMIFLQRLRGIGKLFRFLLNLRGIDIPPQTLRPGTGLVLRHSGSVVIHGRTRIGRNVVLHQGVTVGRSDVWRAPHASFEGFDIQDDVILGANSVVVASRGLLTIATGSVLGANSVLTQSTGPHEIWAGAPARRVGSTNGSAPEVFP
jgi:serine O-acetyltransferase